MASAPTRAGSSTRSTARRTSCTASPPSACRSASSSTAGRWSESCTHRCSATPTPRATGGGAFRNGEPIHVSTRPPEEAMCATGFPFRKKRERLPEYLPVFERALNTFEDLRRAGSASLDLAWTAAGVFDGYFEHALGPWDVAAGALLVREAGGIVTDWAGDDGAWLTQRRHRRRAPRRPRPHPRPHHADLSDLSAPQSPPDSRKGSDVFVRRADVSVTTREGAGRCRGVRWRGRRTGRCRRWACGCARPRRRARCRPRR